jgi:leucyl-tRNA synthetase
MPQWAGSCWYYLRYLDPGNDQALFDEKAYQDWMPVDLYVGGAEHAVLHLLYARFWHKVLFDVGVVKHPEPFQKLVHQGIILGPAYRFYAVIDAEKKLVRALPGDLKDVVPADGDSGGLVLATTGEAVEERFVPLAEVSFRDNKAYHPEHGVELFLIVEKMAKSRGNVVNPDGVVEEFGADSLRVYEMFMGPLEQMKPWQTSGIQGVRRFLDRVYTVATRELDEAAPPLETEKLVHRTVKKVGEDIDTMRFNTAVSTMMILTNHLGGLAKPPRSAVERLVLCLAPFAPHLGEELWEHLGHAPSVAEQPFPAFDPALCEDDEIEIGVQVNGKVRGRVKLAKDASEEQARAAGLDEPNVSRFLEGKAVKKFVYVPGRILNFIVA